MKLYSYIVARDYGFAPNPFNGICTLATCKPVIRHKAEVGDWIIGTGAKKKHKIPGRLIYAMKVTKKITYDEYWNDPQFADKKSHMNGSRKQIYGDNVYHTDTKTGMWIQEDSHHSYEKGVTNHLNLKKDTKYPKVLISDQFFYFGKNNVLIPNKLKNICIERQGHKYKHDSSLIKAFIKWLENNYAQGYLGDPLQFDKIERYNGK